MTIFIILLVVFALLSALNAKIVTIDYYLGFWQCPLPLLMFYAFLTGSLLGFMIGFWLYLRAKQETLDLRDQVAHMR